MSRLPLLMSAASGSSGGSSVNVNGSAVPSPNFNGTTPAAPGGDINVVFQVSGSSISAYVPSQTVPQTIAAVASKWLNSYNAVTGLFTATQPAAADLSDGTTGTGAVVLASAISGFGSGTVTSFSAGNLSPLFTSSVATATTTPALTFSLSTQNANLVFASPVSGGAAAPTFRALVAADIPALPYGTGTVTSVSFTGGLISVATSTTTPALTVAGTSGGIPYFSSASTWATSAALPAGDFVLGGGAGASPTASFSIVPIANGGTGAATTSQNFVFAGPASGGSGAPSFRALVAADIPADSWSTLANATAALTLNNSTFSTTFNQAAGDIWTWGLPSYTAAVSNSPTLELAGSYQSGTGTFAKDFWTIINTPTTAVTNGVDKLIFTHSGTTGLPFVIVPNLQFTATGADIDVNSNGGVINITQQNGVGAVGSISWGTGPGAWGLFNQGNASTLFLEGRMAAATTPVISFGNTLSQTATSGTMIGLDIGGGTAGVNSNAGLTFNPASGTGVFIGTRIAPTIQGTTSGATTALLVNPTYTLTNLTGVNSLLDLQASSVSKFTVNVSGHINNTSGDVQGTLTSASGTTVSKVYTTAYVSTPTVVVTPTSSLTSWFISASSNTGFTITYAPTGAASFNYFVHGNPT